jgi:ribosomal protein S18 acetylase RimI-like enzyme
MRKATTDIKVSIERIHPGNVTWLDHVDEGVFDHAIRREYLNAFLSNPGNLLFVALVNDVVVGMASGILYVHPDKPLQLFVNEVGVADAYQRLGIGTRLMDAILREARVRGCDEAWVATEEKNPAARGLYASVSGQEEADRAVVFTWRLGNDH